MTERRRRWPRRLLIGIAVFVAVLGGLAAYVFWPRSPTPITEQQALEGFRGQAGASGADADRPGPTPGVYSYEADGTEKISIGPLPLPTRDIPRTVTLVVPSSSDDCYRTTLNLMVEHTETTTWCVGGDGSLTLQRQVKQEKVPGFDVTGLTTCDPGTIIAPGADETQVRCALTLDVSGLSLKIDMAGTARVEPGEEVDVGGTTVATRHVVLALDATGDLSGHWNEEYWLTPDQLAVRTQRDVLLDGPGTFDESTSLVLRDLRPQT